MADLNPNTLRPGLFSTHRSEVGAPVVPDAAISATFPPRRSPLRSAGYESIVAVVSLGGGAVPTISIEWVVYDEGIDAMYVVATDAALADGAMVVRNFYGLPVFARISAVAGNPTSVRIRVAPGVPLTTV